MPNTVMNAPPATPPSNWASAGEYDINHLAVSAETALAYGAIEIRRGAADVILAGGRTSYPLLLRGPDPI